MRNIRNLVVSTAMVCMALASADAIAQKTVKVDEFMIQMPGSVDQIALDYVYCKSNDKRRSMRMMTERMEAARVVNAAELAKAYLKTGFCKRVVRDLESSVKGLKNYYLKVTREAGLVPNKPFTEQTGGNGTTPETQASIFKKIGKFLGKLFGGGGASGSSRHQKTSTSSTTTSPDGSTTTVSTRSKVCDVSFKLGGSSSGGQTPPFYPEVPPAD